MPEHAEHARLVVAENWALTPSKRYHAASIQIRRYALDYHLAQLNIARMQFAIDTPQMADFVARLEDVNALADAAPGFVWRLQTEDGDATGIDFFGADYLVNMSVWESLEALRDYVFRSAHREVLARRKQWFTRMEEAYVVLWWIPAGQIPTLEEAGERLETLRRDGPGPRAFSFQQPFDVVDNFAE